MIDAVDKDFDLSTLDGSATAQRIAELEAWIQAACNRDYSLMPPAGIEINHQATVERAVLADAPSPVQMRYYTASNTLVIGDPAGKNIAISDELPVHRYGDVELGPVM